jgi:hypothetical protein
MTLHLAVREENRLSTDSTPPILLVILSLAWLKPERSGAVRPSVTFGAIAVHSLHVSETLDSPLHQIPPVGQETNKPGSL